MPWYGELIVTRWAYEALAVQQFRNNDYTRPLYNYEQLISLADYKRNYWLRAMRQRVTELEKEPWSEAKRATWHLIQNELCDDADYYRGSGLRFPLDPLYYDSAPNQDLLHLISSHLNRLETYYGRMYSRSSQRRDSIIRQMQGRTPAERERFNRLKEENYNVALSKLLRSVDETEKIAVYNERLLQHYDPIYQFPRRNTLKSHFYAPYKRLLGVYIDTYWLNLFVLVASIFLQWLMLYFRVLKRLLDRLGGLF